MLLHIINVLLYDISSQQRVVKRTSSSRIEQYDQYISFKSYIFFLETHNSDKSQVATLCCTEIEFEQSSQGQNIDCIRFRPQGREGLYHLVCSI